MSRLQLYFDNTSPTIQYSPQTAWVDNSSIVWSKGGSKAVTQFLGAQLTFTFNGTSAHFHGASLNDSSSFAPVIDGSTQARVTLPSSDPPTYGVWYATGTLQPGQHQVTINDLPAVTLDYITVEVDPDTVFHNIPALISDSDPSIHYVGSWQQQESRFQTRQPFEFIGDYSTRSSCNPGDTFSFDFAGSDIQFWGVFDWTLVGSVTAALIIDGNQVAENHFVADANSPENIFGVQTNFELLTGNGLTNDLHHVLVNITSCNNQQFSLDYITYSPSFTSGTDAPTGTASTGGPSSTHKFPLGAIVGIVVGSVLLFLVVAVILLLVRRKRRNTTSVTADPFSATSSTAAGTRKEEVPEHMRHLRSPSSREAVATAGGTSTMGTWVIAPRSDESWNINEVVSTMPPPAYPHYNPVDSIAETSPQPTIRGPY